MLKRKPRTTAIFAGNDEMAAGVLHAARREGIEVPKELSVIGFDDFQIASRVWPPLTTIRQPTREIGRMAAEKLMGVEFDGPPESDAAQTLPTLVVRESTGQAPV